MVAEADALMNVNTTAIVPIQWSAAVMAAGKVVQDQWVGGPR